MSMPHTRERKDLVVGSKMPRTLVQRLDAEAQRRGVSRSAVIRWALLKYFESPAAVTVPDRLGPEPLAAQEVVHGS